jgi:hypothetical protein
MQYRDQAVNKSVSTRVKPTGTKSVSTATQSRIMFKAVPDCGYRAVRGTVSMANLKWGALIGAMACLWTAPLQAACTGDYNGPLDVAVAKVSTALSTDKPALLLELVGSQGLTIGQEGEAIPKAQLAKEFDAKTGRYCDFFICAGKPGFLRKLIIGKESRKAVSKVGARLFAVVTLSPGSGTDETELHFVYTDQCVWELTAIGTL